MTSVPRWLLAIALGPACRQISVCPETDACEPARGKGGRNLAEGGAPSTDAGTLSPGGAGQANSSGGAALTDSAGATQDGRGGDFSESSAGAAGALPECETGTADCDGSTFTRCETPLSFSCRHCGGCDRLCQGACSSGQCSVAERILLGAVGGFVTTPTLGFTLVLRNDWNSDLYQIQLQTGQAQRIAENLDVDNEAPVAVGSDRIYALLRSGQVESMNLDGTQPRHEDFEATAIAGTATGIYYTDSSRERLWYKPTAKQNFEPLLIGVGCTIRAASRTSIVLQLGSPDTPQFVLVRAGQAAELIGAPLNLPRVLPVGDGAVALAGDGNGSSDAKLLWLFTDRSPLSFPVASTLARWSLAAAPDGVALELEEQGTRFVQLFTIDGPGSRIGILHATALKFVDERSLWFDQMSSLDLQHGLMRAEPLELADALR